ncbi:hypothetical protein ACS0TY_035682 [Phlomoides rotata]
MASSLITDYRKAIADPSRITGTPLNTERVTWFPPPVGSIKVNTDASIVAGMEVGIGGVARDEHGLACWCFTEKLIGDLDVDSAEAMAVLHAVRWAKDQNVRSLILETDSQLIFKALQVPKPDLSFFGAIVREILSLVSFSWIRRVGNSVAHSLASLARTIDASLFSVSLPPSCLDEYYTDLQNY